MDISTTPFSNFSKNRYFSLSEDECYLNSTSLKINQNIFEKNDLELFLRKRKLAKLLEIRKVLIMSKSMDYRRKVLIFQNKANL